MKKLIFPILFLGLMACHNDDDTTDPVVATGVDITTVAKAKFASSVTITVSGDNLIFKSDGRPNHKSPYWGTTSTMYEPFPAGHQSNPGGTIGVQNYTMTIPAKPAAATTHEATGLFAIGMALNGVPIFNNTEAGGIALDRGTITSFDGAGAHPAQSANYHYHVTGTYTTTDDANLVGFIRGRISVVRQKG